MKYITIIQYDPWKMDILVKISTFYKVHAEMNSECMTGCQRIDFEKI